MNLFTQETSLKFAKVPEGQVQLLNLIYAANGAKQFNQNNIMVLYPTTDIKTETQVSYQYLGTKEEAEVAEVAEEDVRKESEDVEKETIIEKIDPEKLEDELVAPTSAEEEKTEGEQAATKLDEILGGGIDEVENSTVPGVDALAEKVADITEKQNGDTMSITFEIAVPVQDDSQDDESADKIKAKIVENIKKMGYDVEKFKISVESVEIDEDFAVPLKIFRVKMSSKDKVRVLKFKVMKSDLDRLVRLHKILKKMDMDEVLTLLVTKIQAYLKKKGYVISNLVKADNDSYVFTSVYNSAIQDASVKDENDKDQEQGEWDLNVLIGNLEGKLKPSDEKEETKKEDVPKITGGCWGYGWGRGYYAYRPYYWGWGRGRWYYGGDAEKVPVDIDVKALVECSSKASAFKAEAKGLSMALDLIIESDADYKKILEKKELGLLVVKFQQSDKFSNGYRPVAFDAQDVTFDEKLHADISRIVVDADSGLHTYVFYLFVKSKDLKDFEKDPEQVRDKLSIRLRASIVTPGDATPI